MRMRKHYFKKGLDRKVNLDWIDDEWLWLKIIEAAVEEILPTWTDEEILLIYDCLVEDSIRNLFDGRSSPKTISEIYKWIISANSANPFSFNNCCALMGLDQDEMKENVLNRFNSIHRKKLH